MAEPPLLLSPGTDCLTEIGWPELVRMKEHSSLKAIKGAHARGAQAELTI